MKFGWLRRIAGRHDRERAIAQEDASLREALDDDGVPDSFREAMRAGSAHDRGIVIAHSVADPEIEVRLDVERLIGRGHGLVNGSTGSGKTRMLGGIVSSMLRRFAEDPSAPRPWIVDHKGDLADLTLEVVRLLAEQLDEESRNRLLDSIVVVSPFSEEALVPLQILARDPSGTVSEELQAYEVTTLFGRLVGADLGVNQDALLYHLILLGIAKGLTLPELPGLLSNPAALTSAAAACPHPQVRTFFGEGFRPRPASVAGLQSRFVSLLRTPASRRMLSARGCIDVRRLLGEKIIVANFGGAPLGVEDCGRFWSGFFTTRTTRAIFDRSGNEIERKVLIVSDEWQEGLMGGRDAAENYERLLAMSRSKNVGLLLASQSLAGAAKVSSTLPKVVSTNTTVQMLFRSSIEDARALTHLLPVTGRRLKATPFPWEERRSTPFLTRNEELALLVEEAASLPERSFYYWQRGSEFRAQLVRTVDFDPRPSGFLAESVAHKVRVGSEAVPVSELEDTAGAPSGDDFKPAAEPELLGPPRRGRRR